MHKAKIKSPWQCKTTNMGETHRNVILIMGKMKKKKKTINSATINK